MDAAYQYIRDNNGLDLESAYPYEAKDDVCRYNSSFSGAIVTGYVGEDYSPKNSGYFAHQILDSALDIDSGNDKALVNALLKVGPISVAIDAGDRTFQFYKDGVYMSTKCSRRYLNHAGKLIGV
jgi:cathepsin L